MCVSSYIYIYQNYCTKNTQQQQQNPLLEKHNTKGEYNETNDNHSNETLQINIIYMYENPSHTHVFI